MLHLDKVSKSFKGKEVFNGFTYSFKCNKFYKIEGRNGVGKTTLMKIIKGVIIQDSGEISFRDKSINYKDITYIDSNNRSFFHRLTIKQNLIYFMSLNKSKKDITKIVSLMNLFNLEDILDKEFSSLSMGQMQLISILRGLLEDTKVLLLDEVFSNLDKNNTLILLNYLDKLIKKEDTVVILCGHSEISSLEEKEMQVLNLEDLCFG